MYNKPIVGKAVIKWLMQVSNLPQATAVLAYNSAVRMGKLQQIAPPMKGCFVQYDGHQMNNELEDLKKKILKVISQRAAANPNFKGLYDFESFQANQKGPVQKVNGERILESVDKIAENSSTDITTPQGLSLLAGASKLLEKQLESEGLKNIIKASAVAPAEAGASMNHASKRGLPGLEKGNTLLDVNGKVVTVDDAIIDLYGNNMTSIVDGISNMKAVVGVIGLRLQGNVAPDPAKVRIIFMPEVPEQYGLRAVQYVIQNTLKTRGTQLGYAGAEPDMYKKVMAKALSGQNTMYYYISLDYSKYDTRSSYKVRNLALQVLFGTMLAADIPGKDQLIKAISELWERQYMIAPYKGQDAAVYHVPNLLSSGDVMTQLLGNTMNRLYQYAIGLALGYELPSNLGLELGDDTAIPIPIEIVDKHGGYQRILEAIEKIIETWGSTMNVKKQFPNMESTIFLQRLYKYDSGIEGEYSLIRASESLVGAERPRTPIKGVNNLDAIETIGQLGLLNLVATDGGKTTNKDLLESMLVPWGLNHDQALLSLCQEATDRAKGDFDLAGAMFFSYLVGAVGGTAAVIKGLGLESYDQYQLTSALRSKMTLSVVLPILGVVCKAASKMGKISFDYRDVYKVQTKVRPQDISDFLSDRNN